MLVDAPENPLDASGAFSRKLSVRRDTYQLIFTGASTDRTDVRHIVLRASPSARRKNADKSDQRDEHQRRYLSPNLVITSGVTVFRISEPTTTRRQQKSEVNTSDLFIVITKKFPV